MKSKMQKFTPVVKEKTTDQRKRSFKKIQEKRKKKVVRDDGEIKALGKRLWPPLGETKEDIAPKDIKAFTDLPISKKTLEGLKSQHFLTPTDIQRESLMFGLKGNDILGAAKTGSGKTLAFLIPILETLFRLRYTPTFGMAALVITPTRELAYQCFDVLKKVGKFHDFSFGLVIGGVNLKDEAKKMNNTNVVICTPGRLLQHFEQTANFTADELKVLVLDEADKILHLGFAETMNNIVEALPRQRQTLLFSATQTKSVKDLARLSLKRPIYISAHEKAKETTPVTLAQHYIICDIQSKVNTLWSFIKSHRHKKMLVFLACCKEVRYLYQVFRSMQPGVTILCLHGHMKQHHRMEVYHVFSRKQHAVMLATDVAARGLDFPAVNWVLQMDKPENVDTYIHRVGRTARYEKVGQAMLMLMPCEEKKMTEDLQKRKIPISKLNVSKKKMFDITKKLESVCAADKDVKNNAQKAFLSVMKTHHILDKTSFKAIDQEAFAASLGLPIVPKLAFLEKSKSSAAAESSDDDEESDDEGQKGKAPNAKSRKTFSFGDDDNEDGADDDFYQVVMDSKKDLEENKKGSGKEEILQLVEDGKWSTKTMSFKKKMRLLRMSKKITFDDEGNPENDELPDENQWGLDIDEAKKRLKEQDKLDKETQRQRVKLEHREKRLKEKQKRRQAELEKRNKTTDDEDDTVVTLGSPIGGEENDNDSNSDDDDDDDVGGGDEGPKTKRRKLDDDQEEDDSDEDEEENRVGHDSDEEDEEDDSEDEGSEAMDEDSDIGTETIAKEEQAVLALLGGKS